MTLPIHPSKWQYVTFATKRSESDPRDFRAHPTRRPTQEEKGYILDCRTRIVKESSSWPFQVDSSIHAEGRPIGFRSGERLRSRFNFMLF